MNLKVLTTLAALGMAVSSYGQGILLQNVGNNGSVSASTSGLVYVNNGTTTSLFDGLNFNLGVTVLAGTSVGTEVNLGTFTAGNDPKGYTGFDMGQFQLGASGNRVVVPGVAAGGIATVTLQIWYDGAGGLFANYAAAVAGGGFVNTITFTVPTDNPGGSPPVPVSGFDTMPSVTLAANIVPEPSTIALAGLGLASLLAIRRRK